MDKTRHFTAENVIYMCFIIINGLFSFLQFFICRVVHGFPFRLMCGPSNETVKMSLNFFGPYGFGLRS